MEDLLRTPVYHTLRTNQMGYIKVKAQLPGIYVIVIARSQGFMAVNRPESEGAARGQGQFTLP